MDPVAELLDRWRREAEVLRRRGAPRRADLLEGCADELDDAMSDRALDPVTVSEAVAIGGYSESRLRTLLSDGKIPNVGEPGAPRIRRADVPRKPGRGPSTPAVEGDDDGGGSVADRALRSSS